MKTKRVTGGKAFLARAKEADIRLAVATSADEIKMRTNLKEMELADLFDALQAG